MRSSHVTLAETGRAEPMASGDAVNLTSAGDAGMTRNSHALVSDVAMLLCAPGNEAPLLWLARFLRGASRRTCI